MLYMYFHVAEVSGNLVNVVLITSGGKFYWMKKNGQEMSNMWPEFLILLAILIDSRNLLKLVGEVLAQVNI